MELTEKDVAGKKQEMMRDVLTEMKNDIMASDLSDLDYESGW